MAFTNEEIQEFINTPGRTLDEVYQVAKEYGVPAAQIEEAMGLDSGAVKNWTDENSKVPLTAGLPLSEQVAELNSFFETKTGATMKELAFVSTGNLPDGGVIRNKDDWVSVQGLYNAASDYAIEYSMLSRYKGTDFSDAVFTSELKWDDDAKLLYAVDKTTGEVITNVGYDYSAFDTMDICGVDPATIQDAFAEAEKHYLSLSGGVPLPGGPKLTDYIPRFTAGASSDYLIKDEILNSENIANRLPLHALYSEPSLAEVMQTLQLDLNTAQSLIPSNFFKYVDWEKIKSAPDPVKAINESRNFLATNPEIAQKRAEDIDTYNMLIEGPQSGGSTNPLAVNQLSDEDVQQGGGGGGVGKSKNLNVNIKYVTADPSARGFGSKKAKKRLRDLYFNDGVVYLVAKP